MSATGSGTKDDPWVLTTPSGGSEYTVYRDQAADPPEHQPRNNRMRAR